MVRALPCRAAEPVEILYSIVPLKCAPYHKPLNYLKFFNWHNPC